MIEKETINKSVFLIKSEIQSLKNTSFPYPGDICFCTRTSKSSKPKPVEDNFYICRKTVDTKWGMKIVLVDMNCNEVWGDTQNIISITNEFLALIDLKIINQLKTNLDKAILNDCTPVIGEVLKKNSSGLEIKLSTGSTHFISRKIIYPDATYQEAKVKDIISINLPVWFAKRNNIIQS